MSISIAQQLQKFDNVEDRESETAFFRTRVPWIAPVAYLNIIFKPPPNDVLSDAAKRLRMPPLLEQFLAIQNGAILFSGALSIYGVHRPGELLNREDPLQRLPFNIELENDSWPSADPDAFLAIGGYGFDGSRVCLDRHGSRVYLFERGEEMLLPEPLLSWKSLDDWLKNEIARLSVLFDPHGKCLVHERATLPQHAASS